MSGEIPLRFVGPPQQVCYAVAEEGYPTGLVPGKIYSFSPDLAESLVRSSAHWAQVEGGIREEDDGELVEYDREPKHRLQFSGNVATGPTSSTINL